MYPSNLVMAVQKCGPNVVKKEDVLAVLPFLRQSPRRFIQRHYKYGESFDTIAATTRCLAQYIQQSIYWGLRDLYNYTSAMSKHPNLNLQIGSIPIPERALFPLQEAGILTIRDLYRNKDNLAQIPGYKKTQHEKVCCVLKTYRYDTSSLIDLF